MEEQGFEIPDSEAFKAWADSAPAPGEVYPPVARMMRDYQARSRVA